MPDSIVLGEVRRPVLELLPGDFVDLENDPIADPLGADTGDGDPVYQFEFSKVAEVIRETESCVLVHFENGPSIGFPVDWKVKVDPDQERKPRPSDAESQVAGWLVEFFASDAQWSIYDVPGAREWFAQIGVEPSPESIAPELESANA